MKKTILVIILGTMFNASFIWSQGLTEKYTSVDVGIGRSALESNVSNIGVAFTENSIRELMYDLNRAFDSKVNYTSFYLGIKFGKYKGLSHALYFDVTLTGEGKGKFGYNIGYNYPIEVGVFDILLRPSLGVASAGSSLEIGTEAIDTVGVIIKDTDYIDTDLTINVAEQNYYLTPKFEVTFLIEQKFGVTLFTQYDLLMNKGDQEIQFVPGSNSDSDDVELGFDDTFINLTSTDVITDNRVFEQEQLGFGVKLSAYFNRD